MSLHSRNVSAINSAISGGNAEISLKSVKRFLSEERWLGRTNRYLGNIVEILKNDRLAGRNMKQRNLGQYIAASSLLHNADGWAYLGRSIQSLLCGDANSALHLAYYAELRAAMSLLACYGIGVFKNRHYAITAPHSISELPVDSPTHVFAWDCLNHWASHNISGDDFSILIRPHAKTLGDWLAPVSGGATISAQARGWFSQWGMDLKYFEDDRAVRNDASYRPSGISSSMSVGSGEAVKFVRELWSSFEPTSISSFEGLDQHILRLSVEGMFRARSGVDPSEKPEDFERMLDAILVQQAMEAPIHDRWKRFLKRDEVPHDPGFFEYSTIEPTSMSGAPFPVISRAALLLRVATGTTDKLFETASIDAKAVDFWRESIGTSRGLWEADGRPANLADLFADVADAIFDIEQFANSGKQSYHNLAHAFGNVLAPLGGFERVAVWGVAGS